jgi:hypothetical protein
LEEKTAVGPIHVPVWAWAVVALALFALYGLAMENGGLLAARAETLHELFHDARHFIGVPCH